MATGDALSPQTIPQFVAGEDINIEVTCYEEDGTTLRDMTGGDYLITFELKTTGNEVTLSKTSAASEITLGSPDDNSVTVILTDTDTESLSDLTFRWALSGTDIFGDGQFVGAVGTGSARQWP